MSQNRPKDKSEKVVLESAQTGMNLNKLLKALQKPVNEIKNIMTKISETLDKKSRQASVENVAVKNPEVKAEQKAKQDGPKLR